MNVDEGGNNFTFSVSRNTKIETVSEDVWWEDRRFTISARLLPNINHFKEESEQFVKF